MDRIAVYSVSGFTVPVFSDTRNNLQIFCRLQPICLVFFQDKTLHACSVYEIQEYNKIFDINDSEQKLITLEHFNIGSVKSKVVLL
jgi:hypothetical protein